MAHFTPAEHVRVEMRHHLEAVGTNIADNSIPAILYIHQFRDMRNSTVKAGYLSRAGRGAKISG